MISFGIRNLKVFFKDRLAVFFSLLAVFIIIGLYALFLGDVWTSSFEGYVNPRYMMDSWISAGLLSVTSITTTMGAFGILIEDKSKKINKDFIASPVKSSSIIGGYFISAVIIGIIMCLITLVLSELYIVLNGGEGLSLEALLKTLALIVISTLVNSSIMLFFVSIFNSSNAFSTASTLVGTLVGFLTGIYLPIGNLPESVQWVVKAFPISHSAALFRQVMMEESIALNFNGIPENGVLEFKEFMGVVFNFNGVIVSPLTSLIILFATGVVFYLLSIFLISRKKQ